MTSSSPVLVLAILLSVSGTSARSLRSFGSDPAEWSRATGPNGFSELSVSKRTDLVDVLPENHSPCFSLRENQEQRPLLCADRRSHFNSNPFGLRFGKRLLPAGLHLSPQGSLARPRTIKLLPVFLNPRDLEVTP